MIYAATSPFFAYAKACRTTPVKTACVTLLALGLIALLIFLPGEKMDAMRKAYSDQAKISGPLTAVFSLILWAGLCYLSLKYLKPALNEAPRPQLACPCHHPLPQTETLPSRELSSDSDSEGVDMESETDDDEPHLPPVKSHRIELDEHLRSLTLLEAFTTAPYEIYFKIRDKDDKSVKVRMEDVVDQPKGFRALFEAIAHNPQVKNKKNIHIKGRDVPQAHPGIYICNCDKVTIKTRLALEDKSIQLLNAHKDKEKPLTIASLGAGGAYQELVMAAKLAKEGFKQIKLVLIERDRPNLEGIQRVLHLLGLAKIVTVEHYESVNEYCETQPSSIDLYLSIDLEDHEDFVSSSYWQLEKSRLFTNDTIMGTTYSFRNSPLPPGASVYRYDDKWTYFQKRPRKK